MPSIRRMATASAVAVLLAAAAPAAAQEPFRNVLPAGQGETVDAAELAASTASGQPPASFTSQNGMYTGLVGAAPRLRAADLDRFFKPETFGVPPEQVVSEVSPRPGVRIARDAFNVPHVSGDTRADTMYGAGYATAQDRLFFMDVLRHTGRARLTELIGPGEDDANVKADAEQLKIADYSEAELQGMIDATRASAGAEGAVIQADLDAYVAGVNRYISEARTDPSKLPAEYPALGKLPADWKATDTVAIASLIGGIFGKGGGGEAKAAQALVAARARFAPRTARAVFDDFRSLDEPEAPVTTTRRFRFDRPGRVKRRAVALPDLGSIEDHDPVVRSGGGGGPLPPLPPVPTPPTPPALPELPLDGLPLQRVQSNALLVGAKESRSGHPLAVMGPQVGYYSPQILMEIGLHGGGIDAQGATFPGISLYVLIGRGRDFAWSTTTAYADNVDEFVERLCQDDRHYLYKGRCIPFETKVRTLTVTPAPTDPAGTPPRTIRMEGLRSVHGPIQAFATVRGRPVAIAESRSTYGHEIDSVVAYKRLNSGEVTSSRSFQRAFGRENFAFNHFYVDRRHIAYITSGWYPRRAKGTDPSLPAWGTGEWDWRGRLSYRRLPKQIDPRRGYFTNWNNKQAPGWRAADDNWAFGSLQRVQRLQKRVRAGIKGRRKLTLARLTRAMQEAATVDLRGQVSYPLLRKVLGKRPPRAVAEPVRLLGAWARAGGHRRDLDGDGHYEHSAAVALMDRWWEKLMPGVFGPALGAPLMERIKAINPLAQTPDGQGSAFFDGWHGYLDKDLRRLLGRRVKHPLSRRYCGRGRLRACRRVLATTLAAAAGEVRAQYGTALAHVRIRATGCEQDPICDQIEFVTAGAVETPPIPWQDRPTFQQVVEIR